MARRQHAVAVQQQHGHAHEFLDLGQRVLVVEVGAGIVGACAVIAVQNFNEQACILGLGAFYTGMTKLSLSAFAAIAVFGVVVMGTMELIRRWHRSNLKNHGEEVQRLLAIARSDH